jgi:hypothetical protein
VSGCRPECWGGGTLSVDFNSFTRAASVGSSNRKSYTLLTEVRFLWSGLRSVCTYCKTNTVCLGLCTDEKAKPYLFCASRTVWESGRLKSDLSPVQIRSGALTKLCSREGNTFYMFCITRDGAKTFIYYEVHSIVWRREL